MGFSEAQLGVGERRSVRTMPSVYDDTAISATQITAETQKTIVTTSSAASTYLPCSGGILFVCPSPSCGWYMLAPTLAHRRMLLMHHTLVAAQKPPPRTLRRRNSKGTSSTHSG